MIVRCFSVLKVIRNMLNCFGKCHTVACGLRDPQTVDPCDVLWFYK